MTLEEIEKKKAGQIANLPNDIIKKMLEYQVMQGRKEDIEVFIKDKRAYDDGFSWEDTEEGFEYWYKLINEIPI